LESFRRRRQAVAYAQFAADLLGLPYAVWSVRPGRLRLLGRFQPSLFSERDPRA
jgi:hypothetical protein